MSTPALLRPEPVLTHAATPVDRKTPAAVLAQRLVDGETLIVSDRYSTGVSALTALRSLLRAPSDDTTDDNDYDAKRDARRAYREAAARLLLPIAHHRVTLPGAPAVEFLRPLYRNERRFALPAVSVQELVRAWEIYQEGVKLAVLGHAVHPFYGTYVPARVPHLALFGTWLHGYAGARGAAIDVGTGCGVLALMLAKAGFDDVLATDNNPNAIESVRRELLRLGSKWPVAIEQGDLLGKGKGPVDLVVFNPPWMRGSAEDLLDTALYYEDGLFERFFDQAHARLAKDGRVVIVFSNILRLVQPEVPHPIDAELERGRFREVQRLTRKVVPPKDASGHRRRTRERVEVWELARQG